MAVIENPSRGQILERIRAGLRNAVPASSPISADRVIFEPVRNPLERFQQECVANLTECLPTQDAHATAVQLGAVLQSLPAGEIFAQDHPSLRSIVQGSQTNRAIRWSTEGGPSESSQATITLAEALIAQTGSVLVTASCGGRGASIVAPCHIVYATVNQLLPDLQSALANLSQERRLEANSFACVISGSSRTADIEKILVQGAHGPRRLVVILQSTY